MKQNTLAVRSNERNFFASPNTGILGSYPTRGTDACVSYVFVLSCVRSGLAKGWSPYKGSYHLSVRFIILRLILKWEQARRPHPLK
jgi:hypothetical protein